MTADNGINFTVGIHQLEIRPHENADSLEIAIVGGYHAVVPKGQYRTGEYALYIPEAALVPDELLEEIGLTGKLSGSGKNRVKAIRLRGVVSQGIVCRPQVLWDVWEKIGTTNHPWPEDEFRPETLSDELFGHEDWYQRWICGLDFVETLGIEKWRPKVPGQMRGKIRERGESRIMPWIEITNIKKPGERKEWQDGEPVVATEKIHGTHCMVTLAKLLAVDEDNPEAGPVWSGAWEFLVSSKGMGKQGWDLVEEDGNVYWRAARQYRLEEWLRTFKGAVNWENGEPDRIALYGEVFGESIQDLHYGFKGSDLGYTAFDMKIDGVGWINPAILEMFVIGITSYAGIDLPLAPVLHRGPYDHDLLTELASGMSLVGGNHLREGLVVRPAAEQVDRSGSRKIAKYISPEYLLRDKGTEFE